MLVKICGLTTPDAVRAAVEAGADAVGLVLAPGSPRTVPRASLEALLAPAHGVLKIAVYRRVPSDVPPGFDAVQGDVGSVVAGAFLPSYVDGEDLLDRIGPLGTGAFDGAVLVDGPSGGGRGVPADWARVARVPARVVLAGGLSPENVREAVRVARPWGVDVSSGVESAPGTKDPARVARFVAAARAALERS